MSNDGGQFLENVERCIYVTGEITQELINKITPEINRLRIQNPGPITAFIDSEGGDINAADQMRSLLKAPNQKGEICDLVTVVTGQAASAAADLLALGDYAIAYSHAMVVYHGSRQQSRYALTYESATSLATSLRQTNERFARRLAQRIFKRFAIRIAQISVEFINFRESDDGNRRNCIDALIDSLRTKFSGDERTLILDAQKRQQAISLLSSSVVGKLSKIKRVLSDAQIEAEFLKAIIDFKVKAHKADHWLISKKGLSEISDDFTLLHDYYYGSQNRDLIIQIETFGELFLKESEAQEYQGLTLTEDKKLEWLRARALPKMQPIWYFIVSLCRLLQTADYTFTAKEAYWIGLVDEVPGSGLANLREATKADDPTPDSLLASPTASLPPSS